MRLLAYAICALLTATLGDVLVEAFQNAGLFGKSALDANHQGVGPVLGLAAGAAFVLAASIARDRFGRTHATGGDPLVALAREIEGSAIGARLATIVASSLGLVFATEEYERGFGGAAPFDIAHTTPLDALASFGTYIACAMLVTVLLGIVMRALAATCDALVRIVSAFATLRERRDGTRARTLRTEETTSHGAFRLSGPFPDRAPPVFA